MRGPATCCMSFKRPARSSVAPAPPDVSTRSTWGIWRNCSRARRGLATSSKARWNVTRQSGATLRTSCMDLTSRLLALANPSTMPSTPKRHISSICACNGAMSPLAAVNPPRMRTMTRTGMETAAMTLRINCGEGVRPSCERSRTNSKRSAPPRSASLASCTDVTMTSRVFRTAAILAWECGLVCEVNGEKVQSQDDAGDVRQNYYVHSGPMAENWGRPVGNRMKRVFDALL